jgi:hypothetical protein
MEGAASGLRAAAYLSANDWFADPRSRTEVAKNFEAAGYAPDALGAEAFKRSLGSLATIEKLIASAQKRLIAFLKDLERRYVSRAAEMHVTAAKAIARASQPE